MLIYRPDNVPSFVSTSFDVNLKLNISYLYKTALNMIIISSHTGRNQSVAVNFHLLLVNHATRSCSYLHIFMIKVDLYIYGSVQVSLVQFNSKCVIRSSRGNLREASWKTPKYDLEL